MPLLLAHGMAGNSRWWEPAAAHLKAAFRPAALDFSGHGESPWRADGRYSPEVFAADIEEARRKLGWERFVLGGHSLGGRIALDYAARHPERLLGVVAVDFLCEFYEAGGRRFERTRSRSQPVYPDAEVMAARFRLQPPGSTLSAETLRELARRSLKATDGGWTWKFDWRAFGFAYQAVWPVLPKVSAPVLVVRGEHSTLMSRTDMEKVVAGLPRASAVEIAGAHHHVPLDAPEATARAMARFLERL